MNLLSNYNVSFLKLNKYGGKAYVGNSFDLGEPIINDQSINTDVDCILRI